MLTQFSALSTCCTQGGAVAAKGYNISIGSYSGFALPGDATISFSANRAKYGGAMSLSDGQMFANASFSSNTASDYAGAIELENMDAGALSG